MKKNGLKLAAAIILIAIGSSCTPTKAPPAIQPLPTVIEPLPLPVRPVLPRLTEEDFRCLDGDAYGTLITRERLRREYAEELEAIIRATRQ